MESPSLQVITFSKASSSLCLSSAAAAVLRGKAERSLFGYVDDDSVVVVVVVVVKMA